ncbi:MAG: TlpA disulfide reductase family protein [Hyphomonadaceae bacterium]
MFKWRGVFAVLIAAVFVSIPIYFYWEFLTKGMRPPETTQILNRLQKDGVPNFTLKTMAGRDVSIADFKGKVLLINIWATWCAPCVKEFPSLKHLVQLFKGKVVVLAISRDKTREDIDTFVQAFGGLPEDFIIVWDKDNTTGKILGTDVLPETYILSPTQRLLRKIAGDTAWDDPMARRFFSEILDESAHDSSVK